MIIIGTRGDPAGNKAAGDSDIQCEFAKHAHCSAGSKTHTLCVYKNSDSLLSKSKF